MKNSINTKNIMPRILLLDTTGHVVRSFTSYTQANNFRTAMNRPDWSIVRNR